MPQLYPNKFFSVKQYSLVFSCVTVYSNDTFLYHRLLECVIIACPDKLGLNCC